MKTPPSKRQATITALIMVLIVVLALLAPIAVYIAHFGLSISDNHTRWGEMGSAMSGIYSPLLALLALLVIFGQLRSQSQFNTYQTDQSHIEQSKADVQYYLEQLDEALDELYRPAISIRHLLQQNFQNTELGLLNSQQLRELALSINKDYPRLSALWSAIYSILAGLQTPNRFPYEHHAVGTIQKMIVMNSFATCVALDNFHWCLTENRQSVRYEFSPLLSAKAEA